ncbi:hypothetical protein AVEN_67724-1 [Araneus ventricosus]|uniref:Uncharacterized protein n=1 Tax=Araneus ventricosus TaxID=182803 RepID=A0A4Y2VMN2_ARAVE|nr:hypothetical protein AVEN_47443-1 [Araneus ventricosus]GBO26545.1 hypothetical protein AVEN_67724-1 [Araneus ventricosus]
MFILPAVLYLKLLPLFGQCLYHLIVPNKSRPPHAGGAALSPLVLYRPYTLLGLAGPVWVFLRHTGRLATTYDLTCNRPHTCRIFIGIEFRTWNPPAPKPRPYH